MRNTDPLISMRIQPPQIGIFAELESILQKLDEMAVVISEMKLVGEKALKG